MVYCRDSRLAKIMAAIFDFNGSGMLERERDGEGWGLGSE